MSATEQRCQTCGAQFGEREVDCGSLDCHHSECLHNHHDGCPACEFGPPADRDITREQWYAAWRYVRDAAASGRDADFTDLGDTAPDSMWMAVEHAEYVISIRDGPVHQIPADVSDVGPGWYDPDLPF